MISAISSAIWLRLTRSQKVVRQLCEHGFTVKSVGAIKHVTVVYLSWSYLKSFLTQMFKLFDWMAQTGYEHIFFNCQPRDQVTSQQISWHVDIKIWQEKMNIREVDKQISQWVAHLCRHSFVIDGEIHVRKQGMNCKVLPPASGDMGRIRWISSTPYLT